jgi:hypothetical protein
VESIVLPTSLKSSLRRGLLRATSRYSTVIGKVLRL